MYRLYVDEVGTDNLTCLKQDKHRYLSLTGIAMSVEDARDQLEPRLNVLKAQVFNHDPDNPLILHRKEIMGLKGPYLILRDSEKQEQFNTAILNTFILTDYCVITVLIDKLAMIRMGHWSNKHPYHYLMEILVEKYVQLLERKGDIGDIMPEARGKNQNKALERAFCSVRQNGTDFVSAERIQSAIRANNLKFRWKKHNIAGLQLCDLLAHPSHIYVRHVNRHDVRFGDFSAKVREILTESKYDRSVYGKITGYGIKYLP